MPVPWEVSKAASQIDFLADYGRRPSSPLVSSKCSRKRSVLCSRVRLP